MSLQTVENFRLVLSTIPETVLTNEQKEQMISASLPLFDFEDFFLKKNNTTKEILDLMLRTYISTRFNPDEDSQDKIFQLVVDFAEEQGYEYPLSVGSAMKVMIDFTQNFK